MYILSKGEGSSLFRRLSLLKMATFTSGKLPRHKTLSSRHSLKKTKFCFVLFLFSLSLETQLLPLLSRPKPHTNFWYFCFYFFLNSDTSANFQNPNYCFWLVTYIIWIFFLLETAFIDIFTNEHKLLESKTFSHCFFFVNEAKLTREKLFLAIFLHERNKID